LGATAIRITLGWHPGQTELSDADRAQLNELVPQAFGLRIVVAVFGAATDAPETEEARTTYCDYVSDLLHDYPTIDDVVIWNEPNLSLFWRPQFNSDGSSAAPGAYAALLATCWDRLHAVDPRVNVISDMSSRGNDRPRATSNVSHSPVTFTRGMANAFRNSGRTRPLLDTVGLHPYSSSSEVPWFDHGTSTQISQGDIGKLISIFGDSFAGTAQPLLGTCRDNICLRVWLLETGFQTRPADDKRDDYSGAETDSTVIPDIGGTIDQASQLENALTLAYCQPSVGAIFNFLLADETRLEDWQSGVLWADGAPKGSYGAFSQAAHAVQHRSVDCAAGSWNSQAATGAATGPTAATPAGTSSAAPSAPGPAPASSSTISATGQPGSDAGASASGHTVADPPTDGADKATPAAGTPHRTSKARRRLDPATVRAIRRSLARRFPHGISALEVVRSTRNPTWYLADGYDRKTGAPAAAWLRIHGKRLAIVAIARTPREARGPRSAPCDVRPAFSRPLCAR
jgi:hypothetical protein